MFGYVTANHRELTPEQKNRYTGVYCGICRQIRLRSSSLARVGLSYDMAFLALLLESLYEPEEAGGRQMCLLHPIRPREWVDSEYIRYAADMNVLLAHYNFLDDWNDDGKRTSKVLADVFGRHCGAICQTYPRQAEAIRRCLEEISRLEKENCPNPDLPAGVFGDLLAELMVYREDLWAPTLRRIGSYLGRFIYLRDAAEDYPRDKKRKKYNPFLAMGQEYAPEKWKDYQVLAMSRCCEAFEKLPLVQDKALLDNILYSGVWVSGIPGKKEGKHHDSGSV